MRIHVSKHPALVARKPSLLKTFARSAIKRKLAVHCMPSPEIIRYAGLVSAAIFFFKPLCVSLFPFSTETCHFPDDLDISFGAEECTAQNNHSGDSHCEGPLSCQARQRTIVARRIMLKELKGLLDN